MTVLEVVCGVVAVLVLPGVFQAAKELIKDEMTEGVPRLSDMLLRAAANRFDEPDRSRYVEEYQANLDEDYGARRLSGLLYATFTYCVAPRRARTAAALGREDSILHNNSDLSLRVPWTTLRLGGPARRLLELASDAEIVAAVREANDASEPIFLLGGGSNVVIAGAGFSGTILHVATSGVERSDLDNGFVRLDVAAGEDWDALVALCVEEGLSGIEALSGIPGTVGATPVQNVGAYGQEVADVIVALRALDRKTGQICDLALEDCGFEYRSSMFKHQPERWVILSVSYMLERSALSAPVMYDELARYLDVSPGDRAPLPDVRAAILALRRMNGMVIDSTDPDSTSAGAFFSNPLLSEVDFAALQRRAAARLGSGICPPAWPVAGGVVKTSAAWLIEHAGFTRGYGDPAGIAISSKHSLSLTNRGGGTTTELVALAREIAAGVQELFGVSLQPEPVFVGFTWEPVERDASAKCA